MLPGWLIRLLTHGGAAVDVFFILSGMVIVQSLESFGWHARGFLIARAARTYPVYLAMLVLAVAVLPLPFDFARLPWIGPDSVARDVWPVGWPSAWLVEIATHLTMTHGLLPDAVVPGGWLGLLGAAWSLSAEWQFYILALWLGTRTGPRPLAAAFLVVATAGLLWQAAARARMGVQPRLPAQQGDSFSRWGSPARDWRAAIRCAATHSSCWPRWRSVPWRDARTSCCRRWRGHCAWQRNFAQTWRCCARWRACCARDLCSGWARCRYCIYLANEPVHKLLGLLLAGAAGGNGAVFTALWLPGAVVLPVVLSVGLHRWIETPALRWGRRYAREVTEERRAFPVVIACPERSLATRARKS